MYKLRIAPLFHSSRDPNRHSHSHAVLRTSLHAHAGCPAICLSICACKHAYLLSRMAGAYTAYIVPSRKSDRIPDSSWRLIGALCCSQKVSRPDTAPAVKASR